MENLLFKAYGYRILKKAHLEVPETIIYYIEAPNMTKALTKARKRMPYIQSIIKVRGEILKDSTKG